MQEYQELKEMLAEKGDFGVVNGQEYPKRSFIRKIQDHFGINCQIVRDEPLCHSDGELIAWLVTVRAIHTSTGSFQDSDGSCSCVIKGRQAELSVDELRNSAVIRAKNRSVLDLIGIEETSYEGLIFQKQGSTNQSSGPDRTQGCNRKASRAQLDLLDSQLQTLGCKEKQSKLDKVNHWLERLGYSTVQSGNELTVSTASELVETAKQEASKAVFGEDHHGDPLEEMDNFPETAEV